MTASWPSAETPIHQEAVQILRNLIRFDTTNPPGNEAECVAYVNNLLTAAGFRTALFGQSSHRPNLIARLAGRGDAPPLLLHGHVDVVTTANQKWTHPPFEGAVIDGYVWGRGALDMKGGVAMMLAALLRAKEECFVPAGDIVLAILCDEEAHSDHGSKYLVENHPEQFQGIRYAIGEAGGFTVYIGARKLYPIMVAEKQICSVKAIVRGPGGHGSMPIRGGAMLKLARALQKLDQARLPVHVTATTRLMIEAMASALPFPSGLILRQSLNPLLTDRILALAGSKRRALDPLFHNTVAATILHASDKINVIPGEVVVELDGRLLPGYAPDEFLAELRRLIGNDVELEVTRYDPYTAEPDMGWFGVLAGILREADPEGSPIPFVVSGVSDARFFRRLGIQTYGFTPAQLPPELKFWELAHAADERVPASALEFGTAAIYQALRRYRI